MERIRHFIARSRLRRPIRLGIVARRRPPFFGVSQKLSDNDNNDNHRDAHVLKGMLIAINSGRNNARQNRNKDSGTCSKAHVNQSHGNPATLGFRKPFQGIVDSVGINIARPQRSDSVGQIEL